MFLFFFFFKQKTAYEIGVRLVGSEMCIRDKGSTVQANENADGQTVELTNEQQASATTDVLARNKERVLLTMNELDSGPGVPYDRLIEILESQGLEEDDVEDAVQELMDEGKCYEPKLGILKLI